MNTEHLYTVCKIAAKSYIVVNGCGAIDHMMVGRKMLDFEKARAYLEAHQKSKATFDEWSKDRAAAIHDWLKAADRHEYYSDAGCLAILIDGSAVLRVGNGGDGSHNVYVAHCAPEFFEFTGVSLGECSIEPLDYDCNGGKPIFRMDVKSVMIYRYNDAILLVVE